MAKKKKKKIKFWEIYKVVICIFLILIVAGLGVLWNSLSRYESKQQAQKQNSIEKPKTEEAPQFVETDFDEEKIGVAIVAPNTYKVTVDGKIADSSQIFQTETLKQAEVFADYMPEGSEFPYMVAYYVDDVEEYAKVECYDDYGQQVEADNEENNYYQFSFFEKSMSPEQFNYFDNLVTRYVKYCLNEGENTDLLQYFIKGTETYQNICKIEDVKQYSGRKSGYEIGGITVKHFNQYGPGIYRVELDFVYTVMNGEVKRENPTLLDCYIVELDGQWKILQMDISSK